MTPNNKLAVWRTLSNAEQIKVGTLAQNRQGIFFQYDANYLEQMPLGHLSPFNLHFSTELQKAPPQFEGLHAVFSDSLPDGWGRLLMDRVFAQHQIARHSITPLDRLAYVGETAIGALSYRPASDLMQADAQLLSLAELGLEAQAVFDGQTEEVLSALTQMGSSGGARPKAQVYFPKGNTALCRTQYQQDDEAWIVKFTSQHLPLQHDEGLCEAVYLTMAENAGINVPQWQLITAPEHSDAKAWLAMKRFDCQPTTVGKLGRLHQITACGLLDADFRMPSLDYLDLIKATNILCQDFSAGKKIFRRAMFNLFALNQDDHSKNWSFLQDDLGNWQPSPCYDITFSPSPYGEHMTAYQGYGKNPPKSALQQLAQQAGLSWQQATAVIDEVKNAISGFEQIAKTMDISPATIKRIAKALNKMLVSK